MNFRTPLWLFLAKNQNKIWRNSKYCKDLAIDTKVSSAMFARPVRNSTMGRKNRKKEYFQRGTQDFCLMTACPAISEFPKARKILPRTGFFIATSDFSVRLLS